MAYSQYFEISIDELFCTHRGFSNDPRKIAMYAYRSWSGKKLSEILEKFNCKAHSTISNAVFEIKKRLEKETKLRKKGSSGIPVV
jgi:chromosomal replication initiation ATPase DnaA